MTNDGMTNDQQRIGFVIGHWSFVVGQSPLPPRPAKMTPPVHRQERPMLQRKYLFPHVIEMNYQAGRRLGVNVYLIDGGSEWALIDVGYEETVPEVIDLIRAM